MQIFLNDVQCFLCREAYNNKRVAKKVYMSFYALEKRAEWHTCFVFKQRGQIKIERPAGTLNPKQRQSTLATLLTLENMEFTAC